MQPRPVQSRGGLLPAVIFAASQPVSARASSDHHPCTQPCPASLASMPYTSLAARSTLFFPFPRLCYPCTVTPSTTQSLPSKRGKQHEAETFVAATLSPAEAPKSNLASLACGHGGHLQRCKPSLPHSTAKRACPGPLPCSCSRSCLTSASSAASASTLASSPAVLPAPRSGLPLPTGPAGSSASPSSQPPPSCLAPPAKRSADECRRGGTGAA